MNSCFINFPSNTRFAFVLFPFFHAHELHQLGEKDKVRVIQTSSSKKHVSPYSTLGFRAIDYM